MHATCVAANAAQGKTFAFGNDCKRGKARIFECNRVVIASEKRKHGLEGCFGRRCDNDLFRTADNSSCTPQVRCELFLQF